MSELFSVRVLEVSKKSALLWVRSVHPDSGQPGPHAVFALMLMYDPITNSGDAAFKSYKRIEGSALARAMDTRDAFTDEWMKKNARAFVEKVTFSKHMLRIYPTHPAWIEHLRKGMSWRTAAYDAGPGLPAEPRVPAPQGALSRREQDPATGFRVGRPKNPKFKFAACIPLHGPNRYVADPVLSRPAAMAEATKKMLGQPLLVTPKSGPAQVGALVARDSKRVLLYSEGDSLQVTETFGFDELKSLGRAWLVQEDAPTSTASHRVTKRSSKSASPATKTARRGATKVASAAKTVSRGAKQKPTKPTTRSRRPAR